MMSRHSVVAFALLVAIIGFAHAVSAHHSFLGRFDRRTLAEIEGRIVAKVWRNPHAYFTLRVSGANGSVVDWDLETSSISLMQRLGVTSDMLEVGDTVRIAGYPPLGEQREMYARHILLSDGRELLVDINLESRWANRTVGPGSPLEVREGDGSRPELGIFRVWTLIRDGPRLFPEVVDPTFDVQSYPMTDRARAALAAFDLATENPTDDCVPKGMPTIMEQPYPIEFVALDDGDVLLRIEEYDLERHIHMAGFEAPLPAPSPLGLSVGVWDGDALVVTTTRVDWPFFSQIGIPQTADVVIVERFAPTPDGARLDYRLTVTDPAVFTQPVVLENYWIWVPEIEILSYDCAVN
jgi:hypothetical protein